MKLRADLADKICGCQICSGVPKKLRLGFNFRPCSEGKFFNGRPYFVDRPIRSSILKLRLCFTNCTKVGLASSLFVLFTLLFIVNPPDRKIVNLTFDHWHDHLNLTCNVNYSLVEDLSGHFLRTVYVFKDPRSSSYCILHTFTIVFDPNTVSDR